MYKHIERVSTFAVCNNVQAVNFPRGTTAPVGKSTPVRQHYYLPTDQP